METKAAFTVNWSAYNGVCLRVRTVKHEHYHVVCFHLYVLCCVQLEKQTGPDMQIRMKTDGRASMIDTQSISFYTLAITFAIYNRKSYIKHRVIELCDQ